MKIRFLGAARQVTGSCYHLLVNGVQLLVDCGMQQGENSGNNGPFAFRPEEISYLFLTHAHIDHSGLIPKLVKEGFRGKIITTAATADLVKIMLYDSAHIQEKEAEWKTRKALRQGREEVFEPLYTSEDVKAAIPLFMKKHYNEVGHLGKGIKYSFVDAGHILGSGTFELWYQDSATEKKIVFSGDIGKIGNPIIADPEYSTTADYVVIESTYGNRLHKGLKESIDELVDAIKVTFKRGGNVIMPAFAVGRTQDLLYILNGLVREKRLPPVDVYVDSPLAEEATKVYLSHPEYFDEEARKLTQVITGDAIKLHFTVSIEQSQAINRIKSGAIIMAGSGMCEGGRVAHHLKHNLWRPECSIVFTGFQARGTLGRRIVDRASHVHIFGEEIAVRARIYTINGFSAHADQKELMEWLASFTSQPEVFVVHGEENVALDFESLIKEKLGLVTYVPHKGDEFEI
ncbi:MAG: Ribonuclease [Syntrophorhabdus sp. PtaU1.Bin050]|nr:MAG: Ribonuclease [Syntrophorhabdus sp. PtaU1.Bin050]